MKITHLTPVNLEVLTVLKGKFYNETVTLELIEEEGYRCGYFYYL